MMLIEDTAVGTEALPLAVFKEHLRLGTGFADDGLQDSLLESFLRSGMAAIEARTGKALIERRFSWTVSRWRGAAEQGAADWACQCDCGGDFDRPGGR